MPSILAIDIGSSSVRAMVCDRRAVDVGGTFTQLASQFDRTSGGGATLDPDRLSELAFACIDQTLAKAGAGRDISQVAVDTFVSSLMGVDSDGQPATPLYTWSDARGGELLPQLKSKLAPDAYTQRTGAYLHPSTWPLRLAWLREAEPDVFARVRGWTSLGGYMQMRVFGQRAMSVSDAAWTGLLNRQSLTWDAETLGALEISPDTLPEISAQPFTALTDECARRWPQLAGASWTPAIGDGVASNIGAGCTQPHQVALSLGTSGALRVIIQGTPETVPDGLFCYRIDETHSLVGGALSNVGSVYHWLRKTLNLGAPDALENDLAAMSPDSHGLTVLPALAPERSPYWDESMPAAWVGMTAATTPLDMLRAGLESVAFGFARVARRLTPILPPDFTYTAGGAAVESSPALMQILADVLGHPVRAAAHSEATLRGAVLFATAETVPQGEARMYRPDAANHRIYAAAFDRQEDLIRRLRRERKFSLNHAGQH